MLLNVTEPENGLEEGEAQIQMGRMMPLLQVSYETCEKTSYMNSIHVINLHILLNIAKSKLTKI